MENEYSEKFQRFIKQESGFALILARGGSKSIPKKNIVLLDNNPLIKYTIEAAKLCGHFTNIFVSTDDDEIADVANSCGVEVIRRPIDLATDTTSSFDSAVHAINLINKNNEFTWLTLLQPTSPLRNKNHISECLELFANDPNSSAVSVCEVSDHPYKMYLLEDDHLQYVHAKTDFEKPRQLLPKAYKVNGAIYMNLIKELLHNGSFLSEKFNPYIMDKYASIDIDNPIDLKIAELYLREGLA